MFNATQIKYQKKKIKAKESLLLIFKHKFY